MESALTLAVLQQNSSVQKPNECTKKGNVDDMYNYRSLTVFSPLLKIIETPG